MNWDKIIRDRNIVAIDGKFCWLFSGVDSSFHDETTQRNYSGLSALEVPNLVINQQLSVFEEEDQLNFLLYKFWQTEALGVPNIANFNEKSNEKEFLQGVCNDGKRYSVILVDKSRWSRKYFKFR